MYFPSTFQRSDPFALMRSMMRDTEFGRSRGTARTSGFPAINVWQGEEAIAVTAELPGVDPSDIDISVQENVLKIAVVSRRWWKFEGGVISG